LAIGYISVTLKKIEREKADGLKKLEPGGIEKQRLANRALRFEDRPVRRSGSPSCQAVRKLARNKSIGKAAVIKSTADFMSARSARRCCANRMSRSNATGSKLMQIPPQTPPMAGAYQDS
jgi:hypothetical protein